MATVRENLIAARALIDSVEGKHLNPLNAIRDCVPEEKDRGDAYIQLREALPAGHRYVMRWLREERPSHADILALFDRAIAAQPEEP